jgi:hypothetical protein
MMMTLRMSLARSPSHAHGGFSVLVRRIVIGCYPAASQLTLERVDDELGDLGRVLRRVLLLDNEVSRMALDHAVAVKFVPRYHYEPVL